jgi:CHAT domain-containing protein
VITRDGVQVIHLPSRRQIDKKVRSFLAAIASPPRAPKNPFEKHFDPARELFEMLLGPVRDRLPESRYLVISPDGILRHLPFECLVDGQGQNSGRYLLEIVSVTYVPSASVLARLRQGPRNGPHAFEFLGVAQPRARLAGPAAYATETDGEGHPSLPFIPFAAEEVESVARTFPSQKRRIYLGEAATEMRIKEEDLRRFRILHFATHALADGVFPERSAIFLGTDSPPKEDGILWMGEVLDLRLASDLVVLSGCQTGLGQVLSAEGTVGLSWAFLSAGTSSIVVSLWNVNDRSTSQLMQAFYQKMHQGQSRATALRSAKRVMLGSERKAFRHPYYWAPFVLIGLGE